MRELKIFIFVFMYVYIFVFAIHSRNIAAVFLISFLGINYIKTVYGFDKNLKNNIKNQRDFLINCLNHDLKIPTIAQIRAIELIKNEMFGKVNSSQKEMLEHIEESCKCILNLISLIINTYDIENENYKLIYEKFNLSDAIISCFDELSGKAEEKGITFEYNNKIENINIIADKTELRKVIINILLNSIYNSFNGEKLSVITDLYNNKIRVTFLCKSKTLIFPDFCSESAYNSVGHDIIISFCKKIIENHNGKIIKNPHNNQFSFELPQITA